MAGLRTKDLQAIVAFLGDAGTIDGPTPFTGELLERMTAVLGCDFATYNEFDFTRRTVLSWVTFPPEEADDLKMTVADWDHLTAEIDHGRTVERDGIVTTSDHYSHAQRARFESGLADLAEFEILDRMCVRIGPPGARFVLDRRDRDFEARDRLLMHHLQPHLMNLWRRAWVRRRLHAALDALDDDSVDGIIFVDDRGEVEFASASARRLLETHLGSAIPLPTEVTAWRDNGRDSPLVVSRNGSRLVFRSVDYGATLLVREEVGELRLLTRRQLEVMRCVAAGLSNEEIARRLWIEVPTVRKHLEHVFDKLGVRSRTAAVARLRLAPGRERT